MGVSKFEGFVVLLLVCHPDYCLHGVDSQTVWHIFSANDIEGLQILWGAWNTSTPNTRSNLLNWVTPPPGETPWPCYDSDKNWRGVTCLRYQLNATQWDTWVVGLELDDASIVGILPSGISEINKLVTLSLTGNPNLTGNLPVELGDLPLNILDLHDNGFTGAIPAELSNLGNLLELDLSGNQFLGEFPTQFSRTTTLQVYKIARNLLQGEIPENSFENMTQLLILDLSGNRFTGPSPKFPVASSTLYNLNISNNKFADLPELSQIFNGWLPKSLGVLDLSGLNIGGLLPLDWLLSPNLLSLQKLYLNNINISGVLDIKNIQSSVLQLAKDHNISTSLQVLSLMNNGITDVVFDKQFLKDGQIKFYLQGNPYCTAELKDPDGRRCFCEQYCAISPESPKKSYLKVILVTTTICAFLLGSVIFFLFFLLHRKNKHVHTLLKRFDESDVRAKRFEYNELRAATKNFSDERKLGQGAYGAVYKGILPNNTVVAVKQLFMKTQQASEDFLNEVLLITNLQHRNLVALKGYCLHGKEMLLVYEFVDYCDLDKLLLQGGSSVWQVVAWPARMHICLGVAQGLYYLHASSQTKIIHRDIKASNILVDKNLNAKIADFGLARPIQDEKSEILTMQRAGTVGYLAPEYMLYGQLSDKADVYSFGVLLLEIVSGTRNKDPAQPDDEVYLPHRAIKLHKEDRLMEVLDPRLRVTEADAIEVQRVLEIAVMCVQTSPEKRPTMFRVVAMLAGDAHVVVAMDETNNGPAYINYAQYQSTSENYPFYVRAAASSSTNDGSSSTGPFTNGNATLELNRLHSAR